MLRESAPPQSPASRFLRLVCQRPQPQTLPIRITHFNDVPTKQRLVLFGEGPHGIIGAEGARPPRGRAAAIGVVALVPLEHSHARCVPAIGPNVMQVQRWRVQAIACFERRVGPLGLREGWPLHQVDPLAIDRRVVRAFRRVRAAVVQAAPHGDVLPFAGHVPHEPLFGAIELAHDLVVHVVVDDAGGKIPPAIVRQPKVVLVHLRHPSAASRWAWVRPMATGASVEGGHDEVGGHCVGHLRDDVFVEVEVPVVIDEFAEPHVRLGVRYDVLAALHPLPELDLAAIICEAVLVLGLALGLEVAEVLLDVGIVPPLRVRRRLLGEAFQLERPFRPVLRPERLRVHVLDTVDLPCPARAEIRVPQR
mmetsp:Transcript_85082/g.259947  ORF Transcript_85082/g.259947 Transcript_85082/m.259947 type:complete len:364 (-) Transcript_85082:146-1237(-)